MRQALGLAVLLCGVLFAVNSFAVTKITYVSSRVYLAGQNIPQGQNVTAGSIIAALPDHQVIITDNAGNFFRVDAPSGWDPSQGEKIVWFALSTMTVNGVAIQGSVPFGSMQWFDPTARNKFFHTFGLHSS